MPNLIFEKVSVSYHGKKKEDVTALKEISTVFEDGLFHVIVGPSGSGKTTLLRTIIGEVDYAGRILYNDIDIANLTIPERNLSYVSQNFVLYPHLTVFDNIAFPLKVAGAKTDEIIARVQQMAEDLGIPYCLSRRIQELSVGQQQRVALGRALIKRPSLLLFDEPLSNLDAPERVKERRLIKDVSTKRSFTSIYVTHDMNEALAMGDDITVISEGRLVFKGTPLELEATENPEARSLLEASSL